MKTYNIDFDSFVQANDFLRDIGFLPVLKKYPHVRGEIWHSQAVYSAAVFRAGPQAVCVRFFVGD
jgi:hypothetical protein